MKTDIQIAQEATLQPIKEVAATIGIEEEDLELYGKYKAKISDELIARSHNNPDGKLILVTAINPTPAGEGKTTVTVGLGQAFAKLGKKAMIALREPSLGPCFGIKGGAAGGGYSQVVPMEDLNLHFTGDFHAITSANNLLAALLDNHIQQGNTLGIDPRQVVWKRCLDMNDRVLRNVVVGLGNKMDGMVREDHFVITVASEIMAILCLAEDMKDLKRRLGRIIVAYTFDGKPVTAEDLQAVGSMAALLKDALKPNLIQTLEHTPALVHGGPFANIAHGCNSVRATTTALKLADYVITEAGLGADLGAEKFFDIKCRKAGLHPDAVVLVATIRALKYNGGVPKDELSNENLEALKKGIVNLEKHIENLQKFGVPVVVTLNAFVSDTEAETAYVEQFCKEHDCEFALAKVWEKGGEGGIALANKILETLEKWQGLFSCLFQDIHVLPYSFAEIVSATTLEETDVNRVEHCLKMVGLWDKISGFPNGIYEKFNKLLNDDGKELSGGEKQKLLLARSLYRSAPIIILDEPTSALDPLAEEELYQSYNELLGGRTMIFVSHRLSSTRFCDRILFLESGQIAEQGTFEELMEQKGKYAEMFHSQAKYYAGSTYWEAEEHE